MKKWFENLKIGVRIITGFLLVAIIACAIGVIGISSLQRVNGTYKVAYTDSVAALEYVERISSSFQRIRVNFNGLMLAETQVDKDYYIERMGNFRSIIDENITKYKKILSRYKPEEVVTELELINAVQTSFTTFDEKTNGYVKGSNIDSSRRSEAIASLGEGGGLRTLTQVVDDAITKLINYNIDYAANQVTTNGNQATSSIVLMIIGVTIGMLLAILVGLFISHGISKPIGLLVKTADALALGDVDIQVQATTKDEIGVLMKSFAGMIANIRGQALAAERMAAGDLTVEVDIRSENDLLGKKLSEMVQGNNEILTNIASASEQVAAGSKQIADSSMALSQGATEQASSIEELTASLEEMSSQINLNAQNAKKAYELALAAKESGARGNSQMQEMVKAMGDINDSSSSISKIIKVIDEIAFQTNILALNAAVEAARAGQHGKGFAVVAEEVRNLAARSANAAKETTEMIESSIKKVGIGTKIANETEEALRIITEGANQAANVMEEISKASSEQASGIAQINQGIMQLSQVVQTNSATSEESAAAGEELSSQAEVLKESVSKFKLKKINHSNSKFDELSPEVLKMLEDMSERKRADSSHKELARTMTTASKTKIALSDKEFGKY